MTYPARPCVSSLLAPSVFLAVLAWSPLASAWFFGPKTYDDCILEGTKNAQSAEAVAAIRSACANKFLYSSSEPTRAERREAEKRREIAAKIRAKCKITDEQDLAGKLLFSGGRPAVGRDIARLGSILFEPGRQSFSFQNNSKVPIEAVSIGVGKTKTPDTCSWRAEDYKAVVVCAGAAVSPGFFGTLLCQAEARRFVGSNYCVIAIGAKNDPLYRPISEVANEAGWCD